MDKKCGMFSLCFRRTYGQEIVTLNVCNFCYKMCKSELFIQHSEFENIMMDDINVTSSYYFSQNIN